MTTDAALLAVEDPLSRTVGTVLLREVGVAPSAVIMGHGFGKLRAKAPGLNRTARGYPVFLLTDLDDPTRCAPSLIAEWLGEPLAKAFLFRVAVVEVEAWVMADRERFAALLGIASRLVPAQPETIRDPKRALLDLAARSRKRAIRADLLPAAGSTARVGPAYNLCLCEFVDKQWRAPVAAECAPSLARARAALACLPKSVAVEIEAIAVKPR